MGQKAVSRLSIEEYLQLEQESEVKYEYHDGVLVAMAGGSPTHAQLGANFIRVVGTALFQQGSGCKPFSSDLKLAVDSLRRYYYADASIICGPLDYSPIIPQGITNPTLILEVLSEHTTAFDRGKKFAHYRLLNSLKEYVLISQDEAIVDVYYLKENGLWQIQTIIGLDKSILLQSIDVEIQMKDIYHLVDDIE